MGSFAGVVATRGQDAAIAEAATIGARTVLDASTAVFALAWLALTIAAADGDALVVATELGWATDTVFGARAAVLAFAGDAGSISTGRGGLAYVLDAEAGTWAGAILGAVAAVLVGATTTIGAHVWW